jgi:hypothetical protein
LNPARAANPGNKRHRYKPVLVDRPSGADLLLGDSPNLRGAFIRNLPASLLGLCLAREPWFVAELERVGNGDASADELASRFTPYAGYGRDVMRRVIEVAVRPVP